MRSSLHPILKLILLLAFVLTSCSGGASEPTPTSTVDPAAVYTAAAQTAAALMTEAAARTPTALPATPTNTLAPATPTGTATSALFTPTSTVQTGGTDRVEFVTDVTVPDGTGFQPGARFTKTWRVKNAGTSTWTTAYALVFSSGAQMGGPASVPMPTQVPPGGTVDISIELTAPADPGSYTGNWLFRNAAGTTFGLDPDAKWPIFVQITVLGAVATVTSGPTPTSDSSGRAVTAVALSVDDDSVQATCPYTFNFTGQFALSRAATVTYRLEVETGFPITLPDPATASLGAGTHTVTYALEFSGSLSGVARLHVTAPNDISSSQLNFTLTCQ